MHALTSCALGLAQQRPMIVASVPLTPQRDEARDLLERELADSQYQRPFSGPIRQALDAVLSWLDDRLGTIGLVHIPWGPLIILALVIAAIVLTIVLVRPRLQRGAEADALLDTEYAISAAELRSRADEHRRAGRIDEACRDLFRATVRSAEERDILSETAGMTATEAASALSHRFPGNADRIRVSAELFNLSRYGGRSSTDKDVEDLAALDAALGTAQPDVAADAHAGFSTPAEAVAPR